MEKTTSILKKIPVPSYQAPMSAGYHTMSLCSNSLCPLQRSWKNDINIPTLMVKKLRLKGVKFLAQYHPAGQGWVGIFTQFCLTSKPLLFLLFEAASSGEEDYSSVSTTDLSAHHGDQTKGISYQPELGPIAQWWPAKTPPRFYEKEPTLLQAGRQRHTGRLGASLSQGGVSQNKGSHQSLFMGITHKHHSEHPRHVHRWRHSCTCAVSKLAYKYLGGEILVF